MIDGVTDAVPSADADAASEALGDRVPKVSDDSGEEDLVAKVEPDSVELVEVDADRRAEALGETLTFEDLEMIEERDCVFEMAAVTEGELVIVGVVLVDIDTDDDDVSEALGESELSRDIEVWGLDDELPLSIADVEASGDPEADSVGDCEENEVIV